MGGDIIKILHIHSAYMKGGAALSMQQINDGINKTFSDIRSEILVGYNYSQNKNIRTINNKFERYINAFVTRFTGLDTIWYPISRKNKLKKIIKEFDIIHFHNIHGYYFMMNYLSLLKDKKVVWSIRDFWSITGRCCSFNECDKWETGCGECGDLNKYPGVWKLDFSKKMLREKKKYILGLNHLKIIATSKYVKNILEKTYLAEKDISYIYNGIDENIFNVWEDVHFDHLHIEYNKRKVLFLANNLNLIAKGVQDSLEGLCKIRNKEKYQLLFVGEKLNTEVKKEYLSDFDFIEFGYIQDKEVLSRIYAISDLFVNMSQSESFGRTTVEAMLCGTPVLCNKLPIMSEIVGEYGLYINNKYEIGKVMEQYFEHPYLPGEVREHALSFTEEAMVEKYYKLYKSFQ